MQVQLHIKLAQLLDRLVQRHAAALQLYAELVLQLITNGARRDGTKKFAAFTGFHQDVQAQALEALVELGHVLQLAGLALGLAGLQGGNAALVAGGAGDGLAVGQKEVTRIAGSHAHGVAFGTVKVHHRLGQDYVHLFF